jgi:hypothetical protein
MRESVEDGNGDCILLEGCPILCLLCDSDLGIFELGVLEFDDMLIAERIP